MGKSESPLMDRNFEIGKGRSTLMGKSRRRLKTGNIWCLLNTDHIMFASKTIQDFCFYIATLTCVNPIGCRGA